MTTLDQAWATAAASGDGYAENNEPPAGYLGVVRVADTRAGVTKKSGEQYFVVELVDDAQGYRWPIYKQLTKNGQPHEGSIKSAQIALRQLGVEVAHPSLIGAAIKQLVGRYYSVEQKQGTGINQKTGTPFVNTEILGVASAPAQPVQAPAPVAQVPVAQVPQQQDAMAMTAHPMAAAPAVQSAPAQGGYQFPSAVPGGAPTVVPTNVDPNPYQ